MLIKQKGFTIIEVLIAISILMIVSLGTMGMQSTFSRATTNRKIIDILNDVATDQILKCINSQNVENVVKHIDINRNINIYVKQEVNSNCTLPAVNECKDIVISASNVNPSSTSAMVNAGRKVTLKTSMCNFK